MKLLLGCGVEVEGRSRSPADPVVYEAVIPEMVIPVSGGNIEGRAGETTWCRSSGRVAGLPYCSSAAATSR